MAQQVQQPVKPMKTQQNSKPIKQPAQKMNSKVQKPAPQTMMPVIGQKKSVFKKWWFWLLVILGVLIIGAIAYILLVG